MRSLPKLPNEIWTNIIEYMSADDRKSIASVNEKFNELEVKTGYRRFANIKLASINNDDISAHACFTAIDENIPSNEIKTFLKHAATEKLEITGRLNEKSEMKLKVATITLKFKTLDMEISEGRSYRLMKEFARGKHNINEVTIHLNIDSNAKMGDRFLLDFPPFDNVNIYEMADNEFVVNDEMLIHLAKSSASWLSINTLQSAITASGLSRIFEMMYTSNEKKLVICYAQFIEFMDFFVALMTDSRFEHVSIARVVHIATGATFSYIQASALHQPGIAHDRSQCLMVMRFCSASSVPDLESLIPVNTRSRMV